MTLDTEDQQSIYACINVVQRDLNKLGTSVARDMTTLGSSVASISSQLETIIPHLATKAELQKHVTKTIIKIVSLLVPITVALSSLVNHFV